MKTFNTKNKNESGYAILELIFYISIFVVMSVAVINSMVVMTKSFRATSVQAELLESGNIMERISREIRQASNINTISGTDLKLDTQDDAGIAKTVEFLLSGSDVQLLENDLLTGNLNTPNIAITGLTFTQITMTKGKAVKVLLTLKSTNDVSATNISYYDTVVLRGSY